MSHNRFLLVTRAGAESLHPHWLAPDVDRSFDLFVSAHHADAPKIEGNGLYWEHRPGRKVAGYADFLRDHRAFWQSYDYIALFDDDLLVDAVSLNRLFEIAQDHDLKIAQPALTQNSYFTYAALLRHPGFRLRYVTYVEMMCPVFRVDALKQAQPLFDLGYESGIDVIWSNLIARSPRDLAVIDAVTVQHTRRVGSAKASNGFVDGRFYENDIHAVLAQFNCPWLPCLPYAGIDANGRTTERRSAVIGDALGLAAAVPLQRPFKRRARNLAVYWKQLLTASARNVALSWPMSEPQDTLGRDPAANEVEQA